MSTPAHASFPFTVASQYDTTHVKYISRPLFLARVACHAVKGPLCPRRIELLPAALLESKFLVNRDLSDPKVS